MNLKIVCLILSLTALPLCISANNDKEVVLPVENGGDNYSLERKMYPAIPNVFN